MYNRYIPNGNTYTRVTVEDEPSHPTHIMTVWGYGYRWEE